MKILLYDQRECYLNLMATKLKIHFKDRVQIILCMNLKELSHYDKQLINLAVVADNDESLEILHVLKATHQESQIIFVGENYLQFHKVIAMGVREYLIMPFDLNTLYAVIENFFKQNVKWSIPIKETGMKHIFSIDEIKYIESFYDDLAIVTNSDQSYTTHVKNGSYLKRLLAHYFVQVNQSIMVNKQYVESLTERQVVLKSQEVFMVHDDYLLKNDEEDIQNAYCYYR